MEILDWSQWLGLALGAGGLSAAIGQVIKRISEWTGLTAFVIASIISILLAIGVVYFTGKLDTTNVALTSTFVFAIASAIFRFIWSKDRPEALQSVPGADPRPPSSVT